MQQGEQRPEQAVRPGDAVPAPTRWARTYRLRDVTVVELSGEIDLASEAEVTPHLLAAALWPRPPRVVLDLGPVEFIDCFGLSLLVRTRRRVAERGGRLAMVCDRPQTRRLLRLTGLEPLFSPVPTLDDAVAGAAGDTGTP
ncbi:anti-sigma factor antagonist [Actinacidiphila guanduensis]|uniref:Anti-sigma factor antagonist n=1 Tax=Actinacidiphila guanduensis TaxID=310781 RepID=A0A1G9XA57_9ACTN|nr:anti-sigma factor antagonist [Actinacidiphila guanduensis]SDM93618.1 anti-anti-sigma factor [Actinacidiphila guanduensis]